MLVFDHVSVFYGGTQVLRELSFSIQDGEQAGLIGANGAGKSTLMKAALGLVPYTGSITVDGLPVTRENLPAVRRKLGYVLQDADNQMFMPTVLDDMLFGPMNYGLSREEAERQADETLASLRMEHLKLRHNHKMSGGEKRMAAVAAILAMKPDMLLMDEPSTALDPRNRRTLIRVLRARPETKLIASHDLDLVLEPCRRVLLIADGTLAAETYQLACQAQGIAWAVPSEEHQQEVMSVIYDDIKQGKRADMAKFGAAVHDLKKQGCDMAVLGCTELSLVKRDEHLGKFFIDSTEVLCRHALEACGVTPIGF